MCLPPEGEGHTGEAFCCLMTKYSRKKGKHNGPSVGQLGLRDNCGQHRTPDWPSSAAYCVAAVLVLRRSITSPRRGERRPQRRARCVKFFATSQMEVPWTTPRFAPDSTGTRHKLPHTHTRALPGSSWPRMRQLTGTKCEQRVQNCASGEGLDEFWVLSEAVI